MYNKAYTTVGKAVADVRGLWDLVARIVDVPFMRASTGSIILTARNSVSLCQWF